MNLLEELQKELTEKERHILAIVNNLYYLEKERQTIKDKIYTEIHTRAESENKSTPF